MMLLGFLEVDVMSSVHKIRLTVRDFSNVLTLVSSVSMPIAGSFVLHEANKAVKSDPICFYFFSTLVKVGFYFQWGERHSCHCHQQKIVLF